MQTTHPDAQPAAALAIDGGSPRVSPPLEDIRHGASEMGEPEIAAVRAVIEAGSKVWRYSHVGDASAVTRCETAYKKLTGADFALAVGAGGTGALIAGLVGLGVGPGDEVIVPGYTYIASATAVIRAGAVPVIAEIDDSLTLDPADIEKKITPRTKAIVPVHMRGTPCDMAAIMQIAKQHNLRVLEDVAQANGATHNGRWCGTIGDAGAFSFQYYKMITAGEGGLLLAKDRTVFERACMHHDSAMQYWEKGQAVTENFAGENYRMSEINGAILEVQIRRLPGILEGTRRAKRRILEAAGELATLRLQKQHDAAGDAATNLTLIAPDAALAQKAAAALTAEGAKAGTIFDKGIPDRHIYRYWNYVLQQRSSDPDGRPWNDPKYREAGGAIHYAEDMLPQTLAVLEKTVSLPIHQHIDDAQAKQVGEAIAAVDAWLTTT